jgi:hypothetical protein
MGAAGLLLLLLHCATGHGQGHGQGHGRGRAAPAARSMSTFLRYTSPITHRTLSLCECHKCGSSSVFVALFAAIAGHPWVPPPARLICDPGVVCATWSGVHNYMRWGLRGVASGAIPGDVHVHLIRDPISRYLSAFRSKVMCCPGSELPCMGDPKGGRRIVPELLKLARYGPPTKRRQARCLNIDDYALTLRAVHNHGDQAQLNEHILPQHLRCQSVQMENGVLLRGNVSELAPALAGLGGFAFAGGLIRVDHLHASTNAQMNATTLEGISATARSALCSLCRPEYEALNLTFPTACAS